MADLTPKEVVEMLDRYIVGQVCGVCQVPCWYARIHADLKI